jgi:hypothetical protein
MSNTAVGPVYDTIISEVVNAVRVDFEENGVDETALEDLKKVRLSPNPPSPYRCPATTSLHLGRPACPFPFPFHQINFIPICRRVQSLECTFYSNDDFMVWRWCAGRSSATSVGLPSRRLPLTPGREGVESS